MSETTKFLILCTLKSATHSVMPVIQRFVEKLLAYASWVAYRHCGVIHSLALASDSPQISAGQAACTFLASITRNSRHATVLRTYQWHAFYSARRCCSAIASEQACTVLHAVKQGQRLSKSCLCLHNVFISFALDVGDIHIAP